MGEVTKVEINIPDAAAEAKNPSPEAAAKMIQQARTGVTKVEADTSLLKEDRPKWLPEKFRSVEDMAKSYVELEKKMGSKQSASSANAVEPTKEEAKAPPAEDATKAPTAEDATKALAVTGLKMEEFETEYAKEGKLTDASLKKLEAGGIPKAMVDRYIAGMAAITEQATVKLHETVAGSTAKFEQMHEWSKTAEALTEGERNAVNKALESGDFDQAALAFKAVHSKWVASEGQAPAVQLRGGQGSTRGDGYTSMDALMKDMSNPEYQKNESFRMEVAKKLKRSNI